MTASQTTPDRDRTAGPDDLVLAVQGRTSARALADLLGAVGNRWPDAYLRSSADGVVLVCPPAATGPQEPTQPAQGPVGEPVRPRMSSPSAADLLRALGIIRAIADLRGTPDADAVWDEAGGPAAEDPPASPAADTDGRSTRPTTGRTTAGAEPTTEPAPPAGADIVGGVRKLLDAIDPSGAAQGRSPLDQFVDAIPGVVEQAQGVLDQLLRPRGK